MKRNRLQVFRFIVVCGLSVVFFRILQVQIFYSDRLERWAKSQERDVSLKGQRGKIRDRKGRDLAISVETLSFFADPSEIENVKKFSKKVSKLIKVSASEIESKIKQAKGRRFVWLNRQVDRKTRVAFEAIKNRSVEGFGVIREFRREYPHGDLMAQVLGRVSVDGDGIEGAERDFEDTLQGGVSVVTIPRDARGRLFYVDKDQLLSKGEPGKDVDLTIDLHLQSLVESTLDEHKRKNKSDSALALVVDPYTGEILVWAQSPRIRKNKTTMRNLAATDPIEPGSVIKPIIMSWGLERNVVHEKTVIEIPGGTIQIGNKLFKDHGNKRRERLTPEEILKYSSNVGAIRMDQRIGFKDVWSLFEKMGFLEKSGVGLSGESRGIMRKPQDYQIVEQATMSFGQGFAITPLQLLRGFTVIAGDGYLRTLKIDRNAPMDTHPEKVFLNPKTLPRIRKLMEAALMDGGTAVHARVEGYNVAGKTGTSQISDGKKGYSEHNFWTSFVGFLPSDDPKYLIYVALDSPQGDANTGGMTAAPLFSEIARLCLRNEEPLVPTSLTELNVKKDGYSEANPLLRELAQVAHSDNAVMESALLTDEAIDPKADLLVPNYVGKHLKTAVDGGLKHSLDLRIKGQGHYVRHQYPPAGSYIRKNRRLVLFLK
ncbi:MAG: penicillin-binding transpeptidase domain-containing protein [Bdellovibrionota bacterium]